MFFVKSTNSIFSQKCCIVPKKTIKKTPEKQLKNLNKQNPKKSLNFIQMTRYSDTITRIK